MLCKSRHDKRVKIIACINRQHRNKDYWVFARRHQILELIGRECVLGACSESNQSRSLNGRQALVPRIVESQRTRNSLSGISTPKLSRIILRQAGTQESRASCLWKGGFDGIAMFLGQYLRGGEHVFNRCRCDHLRYGVTHNYFSDRPENAEVGICENHRDTPHVSRFV